MGARFAEVARATFSPVEGPRTALVAGAGAIGLVLAALTDQAGVDDGPVICPCRRLTGLPCPGCGLTRSWVFALHGDLGAAVLANPFGLVLLVGVGILFATLLGALRGGRSIPALASIVPVGVVRAVVVCWLAFGALRFTLALCSVAA